MDHQTIRISKAMSRLLRHTAVKEGVPISDDGKVHMTDLINWLQKNGHDADRNKILEVITTNSKQRFGHDQTTDTIWANQGHTIEVAIKMSPWTGQGPLVHASYIASMKDIQAEGLKRMSRQHVHMIDPCMPGCWNLVRPNANMFVLIDTARARETYGITFQVSDNGVVLTEGIEGVIPVDCLTFLPTPRKTGCYGFIVQTADGESVATVRTRAGHLGFPKGKRHRGEHALACALRELYEETGLTPDKLRVMGDTYAELNEKGNCPVVYFHAYLTQPGQPQLQCLDVDEDLICTWLHKSVLAISSDLKTSRRKVLADAGIC